MATASALPTSVLIGRKTAQGDLAGALDTAAAGFATTVSVLGEAGSGKTLLLEWLIDTAVRRGFRIIAVRPVEGEADLPLAVMTDVLRPLTPFLDRLDADQRDVLAAAGGGTGRASADRLLLATATLAVLAAAAEAEPLLLIIDDAHWVDPASAQALSFAIRRLLADRVAVVVARRAAERERIPGPWREVRLAGLTQDEVATLLAEPAGGPPADAVVERILAETAGNPLAVVHLAGRLSPAELTGAAPLPMNLPLLEVAHRMFASLVRQLPGPSRTALAVVAAAGSAAAQLAPDALSCFGLTIGALVPAEDAGLVTGSTGTLAFVHPLYRAAALQVTGPDLARRAHGALAAAAEKRDPQRHAWHRGLSVLGTDEDAAAVVERAADAATLRVGAAANVGLRRLAVALSPPGDNRDRRELDAVRALVAAGHHAEARDHLEALLARDGVDEAVRADAIHHEARLLLWDTPLDSEPAADRATDGLPPRLRAAVLSVSALRARNRAELRRYGDLARAAHAQAELAHAAQHGHAGTLALLPTLSLVAEADLVTDSHTAPAVRDAVSRVERLVAAARGAEPDASAVSRGLAAMLDELAGSPAQMLTWTDRVDLAGELIGLWLSAARARPASVAYLLMARTELSLWTGELLGGLSAAERAIELSREVGSHVLTGWTHAFASRLCAAMGDEPGCTAHGEAAVELGARLNEPGPLMWTSHARGQLLLSTGRFDEAARTLEPVATYLRSIGFRGVRAIPWQPDYVEALSRAGRTAEAAEWFDSWVAGLPGDCDAWHRAVVARCRVLVHGEGTVDELTRLVDAGALRLTPLEEARAQLVAGTALRRRRRPTAARERIGLAAAAFTRLGAAGWRASAEAEPAGRGRRPSARPDASGGLTPQEMRVAQEIACGATNREAAGRLFCSPKTVEYHLTRVYAKLGVRTRTALAARLADLAC